MILQLLFAATIPVTDLSDTSGPYCTLRHAVYASNNNVAFQGCPAGDSGMDTITFDPSASFTTVWGDIAIDTGNTLTIIGNSYMNIAGTGGYRIFHVNPGASLDLQHLNFTTNNQTTPGSGGLILNEGALTVSNALFSFSNASGDGGGIAVIAGSLSITDSYFTGTNAQGRGGGIFVDTAGSVSIDNVDFEECVATLGGAGVSVAPNRSVTITGSHFGAGYPGTNIGGGIECGNNSNVSVSGGTFTYTNVNNNGGYASGNGCNMSINGSYFAHYLISPTPHRGISWNGGTLSLQNVAFDPTTGGCLEVSGNANVSIGPASGTGSVFDGCDDSNPGGAIRINGGSVKMDGGRISNSHGNDGGAVAVLGGSGNFDHVSFVGNHADNNGGTVLAGNGQLTVTHSTLRSSAPTGNTVFVAPGAQARLSNVTLLGPSGPLEVAGGQLVLNNVTVSGAVHASVAVTAHNTAASAWTGTQPSGANNFIGDAKLRSLALVNGVWVLMPSAQSPLIDAGAACEADDVLGRTRGAACDIGAVEANLARPVATAQTLSIVEGGRIEVVLATAGPSDEPLDVTWTTADGSATAGQDYSASVGGVTFDDTRSAYTLVIGTNDDKQVESDETLTLTIVGATPASFTFTVTDNDLPSSATGVTGETRTIINPRAPTGVVSGEEDQEATPKRTGCAATPGPALLFLAVFARRLRPRTFKLD